MSALRGPAQLAGIGMTSQRTRARMVERLREQGIRSERLLGAMGTVPRHIFVEEALASRAYEDSALPIGFGQTISQPYVVALMIEALMRSEVGERALGKVLEIGTGCGYQAAVLAQLTQDVYSVERLRALNDRARSNLRGLKLSNLRLVHADGNLGLKQAAPFDSIVVAAAAREIPEALVEQMAIGGRLVLPLHLPKTAGQAQRLVLLERSARAVVQTELDAVRFVPLESGKG